METPRLLAADWVLPVDAAPIPDGAVAVEEGRIAWVGARPDLPSRFLRWPLRAFPRSLLLPGWVNAHAHLNLTAALGAVPGTADDFGGWIRRLIALRAQWTPRIIAQAIQAGLDLLAHTGTTTTAHLDTLPELDVFLRHPLRAVIFHEAIGFPEARADTLLAEAEEWLDSGEAIIADAGVQERVHLGLAAHAPYTASPRLIGGLRTLAVQRGLPCSIHLAETREEAEFVATGSGGLRALLEERGQWDPGWTPPSVSPVEYLQQQGALRFELGSPLQAVHANYLSDADVKRLRDTRATVTWCPGSHLFFGHPSHPAPRLLAAGVPLALGTDSVASNAGLNMLREVRLAAAAFPEMPREAWLRAGTLTAAEALGLGGLTGSLTSGKAADLQVLERPAGAPEGDAEDPLLALIEDRLRVRLVLVAGEPVDVHTS